MQSAIAVKHPVIAAMIHSRQPAMVAMIPMTQSPRHAMMPVIQETMIPIGVGIRLKKVCIWGADGIGSGIFYISTHWSDHAMSPMPSV